MAVSVADTMKAQWSALLAYSSHDSRQVALYMAVLCYSLTRTLVLCTVYILQILTLLS